MNISIKDIPTEGHKYQGYLWLSDSQEPKVFNNEEIDDESRINMDDNANPFIIEGQLYDGKFSYSIKYVDGEHQVKKYNLEEDKKNGITRVLHFKGNSRLEGHNLVFHEVWEPVSDNLCCDMEVFEAKKFIFGGFK